MTTPFKHRGRFGRMRDDNPICMPLFQDEDDDRMVTSPPRAEKQLPTARLFDDGADPIMLRSPKFQHTEKHLSGTFREVRSSQESSASDSSGSVLRPVDLNSSPNHGRKRPSERYSSGREQTYDDSDEDMFASPKLSPAFRTIDGRMVTSKNPFSPYTPNTMEDVSDDSSLKNPPEFPLSLTNSTSDESTECPSTSSGATQTSDVPMKINLRRRDNQATTPFKTNYFSLSKVGYPDRSGRYSFTGSPIEEVDLAKPDITCRMRSKVRKLHLEDSVRSGESRRNNALFVDTEEAMRTKIRPNGVSPTDVMSFPPPPTPTKAARPSTGYVPLRVAPPGTPTMERRTIARRPFGGMDSDGEGDGFMGSSSSTSKPKSRFSQDFDIIGELGDGSFGTVYKCLSRLDGCMYAVKAAKRKAKGAADRDRMLKEVYALAALSDQADTAAFHIVRYHQAWMEESRLYIQTELCSSTLLMEMSRGRLPVPRSYKVLREILLALEFIHRNRMVHLDIKPENIFIKNDQFKLGDFGLVNKVTNNNDVEEGDSRYMPLEMLSSGHQDLTKCDIFSLGATMYEVCLGKELPTHGTEWQNIRSGNLQPMLEAPLPMVMFVKEMMYPDPEKRPQPSALLKRRELLSDEQKQLIAERHKVLQANMALALQTERLKKLTPPRPNGLIRANTWNGGH